MYGYLRHPGWESCNACATEDELFAIEGLVPGASGFTSEYVRSDGTHDAKAGPCVQPVGLGDFIRLRTKLDGCMAGSMLARDAAAESLQKVMIPAALDYPQ